ncbi:MAG: hypothetical protein V1702_03030 [Candidatus Woesearchaeota archaeon]
MMSEKRGRLKKVVFLIAVFSLVLIGVVVADQVGPKSLWVAISFGNTAPVVFNSSIAIDGSVTLADSLKTEFTVYFNVTDADGVGNINNARAGVNVSFNGVIRSNNSGNCAVVGDSSTTTRAFSCIVVFYYYDNASALWDMNLSAADNANSVVSNYSEYNKVDFNLTLSSLSAFTLVTPSIATTSVSLGSTNNELSLIINNTGNFDFTVLNVTPFDLNASLTDFFKLEGNFSINATQSATGLGDALFNNTPRNFTVSNNQISATLPHKITSAEADKLSNRTMYIYIDVPLNKGLSSGVTYNSSSAWQLFAS